MKRFLFLIFFIFSIFVCAAEGVTVYYPQNIDELSANIDDSESGDIIELNSSVNYVLTEQLPTINTSLIINGNNAIVDGNNTNSIFHVGSDANFTINNLHMINGYGVDDAAVLTNNGVVNINHCSFIDNERIAHDGGEEEDEIGNGQDGGDAYGGAIYNSGIFK